MNEQGDGPGHSNLFALMEVPLLSKPDEVIHCQHCNREVIPNRIYEPTTLTWLLGSGLCMIGCWFGVCLAPLCSNHFQVATVYCTFCEKTINTAEYI